MAGKKATAKKKEVTTAKIQAGNAAADIIYLGVDLGTSHCSIASSNGLKLNIPSIVGWPKDFIAYNVVKKPIVYGEDCIKHRTSLDIVNPLERGVIKYRGGKNATEYEANAASELLKYMLGFVERRDGQKILAVVGAPALAEPEDKQAIVDALVGLVDSVLLVSEPFLVAYNLGMLEFAVVVDIGAGTLDICRMSGTIPDDESQKTLYTAGDEIDRVLFESLHDKIPGVQLSPNFVRTIKEEHGFVGDGFNQIEVELYVGGHASTYDITEEVRAACSICVPVICDNVRELITSYEPEYIPALFRNIILTGGCSKIKGLDREIELNLADDGLARVNLVGDPAFQIPLGSLRLAQEIPPEAWK